MAFSGYRQFSTGGLVIFAVITFSFFAFIFYAGNLISPQPFADIPADRALAQVAPSSGLVAHYAFDGNTNDSVGGNNGTLNGGATFVTGRIGQAVQFNGTSNYINLGTPTSLQPTSAVSVAAWFRSTDLNRNSIVRMGYSGYALILFENQFLQFGTSGGAIGDSGTYADGNWHHAVGVYDGTTVRLYADGVLVGSSNVSGAITYSSEAGSIGSSWGGADFFHGPLDDVRIYNRALTAQEASDLYASAGSGGGSPPPTCTSFTYSAYGSCQPDSTQTRSVQTSSPSGCTGGSPVTSQSCTYVPPASDTTAPTISLTAPSAGTVSGSITVSATAADNVGVAGVQFKLDGANLSSEDTTSPYSISWNTSGASNGAHTLTATARDSAGNQTTSAGVNVTVSNTVVTPPPPSAPGVWPPARSSGAGSVGRDSDGWTIITPAVDSRLIYVSAAGNDANDGLSEATPRRTVAAGKALLRAQMPDWLLLRAGDTWNEAFGRINTSGRSSQEPLVITYYGSGNRPVLSVPPNQDGIYTSGGSGAPATVDHVAIVGIAVVASNKTGSGRSEGMMFLRGGTDLTVEDNVIDGFNTGLDLQGLDSPQLGAFVRRNIIIDNHPGDGGHSQGMFMATTRDVVIEENTVDRNGWLPGVAGADGTIFNHNFYIAAPNYNVMFRNNISSRAASNGLQLRPGGSAINNLFLRNGIAFFVARNNGVDNAVSERNVVMGSTDIFNSDSSVAEPRGWGEDIIADTGNGSIHQNNIFVDRLTSNGVAAILTPYSPAASDIWIIRDNVIRNWSDSSGGGIDINPAAAAHFQTSGNVVDGRSYETGAVVSLPDPNRSLRTYMQSIGFTVNSADEAFNTFIQQARNRPLRTWDTRFIAATVNDYMRAGLMPGGSGTPSPTCTSFTYSAYGSCQSNNTQTRSIQTSSPSGCTGGSPILSQSCTYVPPSPTTCTSFTYSAYGACQSDSTQARTVQSSSPTGCTGGTPILSQSCTYVAPTCSTFTYSAWSTCSSNNTQSRTALTSAPSGCTGGNPLTSQSCTYTPPVCTSFTYSGWGLCQFNNSQTRTALTESPTGCSGGSPLISQFCVYTPPIPSAPICSTFTYSPWSTCGSDGTQDRTALTANPAGCTGGSPFISQSCTYTPPVCTSFIYSNWSQCAPDGLRSRTALSASPSSCTGGTPIQTQSCTYSAPVPTGGQPYSQPAYIGTPSAPTPYTAPAYVGTPSNPTGVKTTPTPSPSPSGSSGGPAPQPSSPYECSDTLDNDFDGAIDMADLDCSSPQDKAEIIDLWRILRQILYFLLQWGQEMWGRGMRLVGR